MKNKIFTLFFILTYITAFSQIANDTIQQHMLSAKLIDGSTSEPLTYASIFVVGSTNGVVSNEKGYFEIDITGFPETDTIRFQFIGYKQKDICIANFDNLGIVTLDEEIYNLSETVVFGTPPKAKDIVKRIIENKDRNYRPLASANQVFVRQRSNTDLKKVDLNCKKSSVDGLDKDFIGIIQRNVPKESISYTDFLGWVYNNGIVGDSAKMKIEPIRTVSLKEKDIAELDQMEEVFVKVFRETKDGEYWKMRTGILSQKVDVGENQIVVGGKSSDTLKPEKKDTIPENSQYTKYYNGGIKYRMRFASLDDKDQWEFLYKTSKYKYTIAGGTRVNGEDVYIIDFESSGSGMYVGKMYVSISTYALIRADYQYAPEKKGRDIHMFGIGYTESQFAGSIYFEKHDSTYSLKYFTTKAETDVSFDRSISLLKKRERFLFDKTLNEIKIGIDMYVNSEESYELLVISSKDLPVEEFAKYEQPKYMEIIYVDQFDDKLWAGYPIIAPTKRMKEYKKQGL